MNIQSINNSDELIQILGNRIEEIERILDEDEDFCNRDIDETYRTGQNYLKSFEGKIHRQLTNLKAKLDQIREENINVSKQNKKQFDEEIEEVNQLFLSGKYQEGFLFFKNLCE